MAADTVVWIEPNGIQHNLSSLFAEGVAELIGRVGFDMPPVRHIVERIPLRAGARHRYAVVEPREIDLPLHVATTDYAALRAKIRDVERWFYPDSKLGNGILRVTGPDGTTREIRAYYQSGLQGQQDDRSSGVNWRNVVITLIAPDPFFYQTAPSAQEYVLGTPATFFGNPWFPLKLNRTDIFSSAVAINPGDLEVYPVWTITGPMTRIVLTNITSNPDAVFDLTYTLMAGETITVDAREDYRTVFKNDGTNLYEYLTVTSELWPLEKGVNNMQIEMTGATIASKVRLEFTPRYLGV